MSIRHVQPRYDVIVAGARAAGASTAMLLARAGARVLLVDPARRGSDTLSTHALIRAGVLQLHRWGLLDAIRAAGTPTVRTTTFHYGDEEIALPIAPRDGVDGLYAPRRTVLDGTLVAAAVGAGAQVMHGARVLDLSWGDAGRVRGAVIASASGATRLVGAGLVIGADGGRSRVAELAGARIEHLDRHSTATIYGYWPGLGREGYHWYFRPHVGAGVIPTNGGEANVFVGVSPARFQAERGGGLERLYRDALREAAPEVAEWTERHRPVKLRAFAGAPGFSRRPVGPGWALVGDAGSFRDPITSHGITDALRDAELLARATAIDTAEAYRTYHELRDSVSLPIADVTDRIASLAWTLDEVKALHLELSRATKAEVDLLRGLEAHGREPAEQVASPSRDTLQTSTKMILSPL